VHASAEILLKSMDASTDEAVRTAYVVVVKGTDALDDMMVFRDRSSHEAYQLDDQGVILTEQLAGALGVGEGDSFTLQSGSSHKATVTVSHVTENYLMHYIYMTETEYELLFGEQPEYNMYLLGLTQEGSKQEEALGKELLTKEGVLTVTYVSTTRNTIEKMLNSLYLIVLVLVAAASLLAFVVIYNLNNINISERRRELATLKLLGFYDMEVAAYVYRENIYLTGIGAVAGIGIGPLLHRFVINTIEVNQVMFGREISPASYLWCVVLTIVFSAVVNVVMYFQLKKIDMIESLKSVE
jgi:putative ABC transport system permease protein